MDATRSLILAYWESLAASAAWPSWLSLAAFWATWAPSADILTASEAFLTAAVTPEPALRVLKALVAPVTVALAAPATWLGVTKSEPISTRPRPIALPGRPSFTAFM
ncbi:hypothetical protein D3C86_1439500 [compost metagenome]